MHVKTSSLMRHTLKPIIICLRVWTYSWVMFGSCFTALYERTGIYFPVGCWATWQEGCEFNLPGNCAIIAAPPLPSRQPIAGLTPIPGIIDTDMPDRVQPH